MAQRMAVRPSILVVEGANRPSSCKSATRSNLLVGFALDPETDNVKRHRRQQGEPVAGLHVRGQTLGDGAARLHHARQTLCAIGGERHPDFQRPEPRDRSGPRSQGHGARRQARAGGREIVVAWANVSVQDGRVAHQQAAAVIGDLRPFMEIERDGIRPVRCRQQGRLGGRKRGQRAERAIDMEPRLPPPRYRRACPGHRTRRYPPARGADDQERMQPAALSAAMASRSAAISMRKCRSSGIWRKAARPKPAMSSAPVTQRCTPAEA